MDAVKVSKWSKEVEEIVDNLTLFDDDLMSMVFDNNIKAASLLLRIILQRDDMEVLEVVGQRELENPIVGGRNIRLDIWAQDAEGRYYDIEVQRSNEGAHIRRARFHSSMLDVRMLKEKQKFKEMSDSYVIFLTEHDIMGLGLPLYHISRVVEETGKGVGDGSHIIYVNGAYRGEDTIGMLVHDFYCKNAEDIFFTELREGVQHFKALEGRENMCKAVENYAEKRAKESMEAGRQEGLEAGRQEGLEAGRQEGLEAGRLNSSIENLKSLMEEYHLSMEQAMNALRFPEDLRASVRRALESDG